MKFITYYRIHGCDLPAIPCPDKESKADDCRPRHTIEKNELYGFDQDIHDFIGRGKDVKIKCREADLEYSVECHHQFPAISLNGERICNMDCNSSFITTTIKPTGSTTASEATTLSPMEVADLIKNICKYVFQVSMSMD